MTYFQNIFLYDSKTLIFSYLHGSVGQGNDYLFFSLSVFGQHNFNWKGVWGWEHDSKTLIFSHWHERVGQGNNDLLFIIFSDCIFLLGLEDGRTEMGVWGWERRDGSLGMGAWG